MSSGVCAVASSLEGINPELTSHYGLIIRCVVALNQVISELACKAGRTRSQNRIVKVERGGEGGLPLKSSSVQP